MEDALLPIDLGLDDGNRPVVLVGDDDEAADPAQLLLLVPALATPPRAAELARALNHLAHGNDYRVITDPAAFEAAYRARLATEDPSVPWREGVVRLCDFGEPDYGRIHPPAFAEGALVFFAEHLFLGVPYEAVAPAAAAIPSYKPVPLTPVATDPAPPRPGRRRNRRDPDAENDAGDEAEDASVIDDRAAAAPRNDDKLDD